MQVERNYIEIVNKMNDRSLIQFKKWSVSAKKHDSMRFVQDNPLMQHYE